MQPTTSLYNWLLSRHKPALEAYLPNAAYGAAANDEPQLDNYSGRLQDARLLDWVAKELGEKRIWSASQFNDYGMCGFRFFSKRLLKLEEIEEPETGMDAAQRGTVIHAILEDTYRELAQKGISITPEHMDMAIAILRDGGSQNSAHCTANIWFPRVRTVGARTSDIDAQS